MTIKRIPRPTLRTDVEREILRVLWAHRDRYLVRSQVLGRMASERKPTAVRVGQVLRSMAEHGLLETVEDRFRGSARASFYRLTDQGKGTCIQLGLVKERPLFSTTEIEAQRMLSKEALAGRVWSSSRLVGFYSYRGGLGRTTTLAHVAYGLARRSPRRRILVIDFDLGGPELDQYLAPRGGDRIDPDSNARRGLRGLLYDASLQKAWRRDSWLDEAIREGRYFLEPDADLPHLSFLSSGLLGETRPTVLSESAAIVRQVREEAEGLASASLESPLFPVLRRVLLDTFDVVLIDSQHGRSLSAYLLTRLVDQLVVCLQPSDTSQATLVALRSVLATFLGHSPPDPFERDIAPRRSVCFAFALRSRQDRPVELSHWIDTYLRDGGATSENQRLTHSTNNFYDVASVPFDPRLKDPTNPRTTPFFRPLIQRLEGVMPTSEPLLPEHKALAKLLDPRTKEWQRELLKGILLNTCSPEVFAGVIGQFLRERAGVGPVAAEGLHLLSEIAEDQHRRLMDQIESLK